MTIDTATLDSAAALEILLSHVADKPVPMARLACLLLANGQGERARKLCARAIALAPHDAEVHVLAAETFIHGVLRCYFPLVQDTPCQSRARCCKALVGSRNRHRPQEAGRRARVG